jgi:hypothetical protein
VPLHVVLCYLCTPEMMADKFELFPTAAMSEICVKVEVTAVDTEAGPASGDIPEIADWRLDGEKAALPAGTEEMACRTVSPYTASVLSTVEAQ